MSKVLVVYGHDVGEPAVALALVEKEALAGYPLAEMNGHDCNGAGLSDEARDAICELGFRLGIVSTNISRRSKSVTPDLKHTVNPKMPVTVDEILICSWHL